MLAERVRRAWRRRPETGATLVELMVGLGLLSVVMTIALTALVSLQNTENRVNLRKRTNDQVRLAVEQIDKQVRSGNVPYNPATEGNNAGAGIPAGFSMRVYTQANGTQKCVQWRVSGGKLESRSWTITWQDDGQVSGWRTVAENVVNPTSTPPFTLDTSANFGGAANPRLINVDVLANASTTAGSTVEAKASITGRNFQFGYPQGICNTIPTP